MYTYRTAVILYIILNARVSDSMVASIHTHTAMLPQIEMRRWPQTTVRIYFY